MQTAVSNMKRHVVKKTLINDITFFITDTSVLLDTPLVKFIRNYIRDSSGVFPYPPSLVKISMISLISSLSLKLYLNSLVYDRERAGRKRDPGNEVEAILARLEWWKSSHKTVWI